MSWKVFCVLEAHDWKFLPFEGSLLDQPDWLMEDLTVIAWRRAVVEELTKSPATAGGLVRDQRER